MLGRERDQENGPCHAGRWMPGRRFNFQGQSDDRVVRLNQVPFSAYMLNERISQLLRDIKTESNSTR